MEGMEPQFCQKKKFEKKRGAGGGAMLEARIFGSRYSQHFILCLLAFIFLFWLGSTANHRPHTPTTIPFQYFYVSHLF